MIEIRYMEVLIFYSVAIAFLLTAWCFASNVHQISDSQSMEFLLDRVSDGRMVAKLATRDGDIVCQMDIHAPTEEQGISSAYQRTNELEGVASDRQWMLGTIFRNGNQSATEAVRTILGRVKLSAPNYGAEVLVFPCLAKLSKHDRYLLVSLGFISDGNCKSCGQGIRMVCRLRDRQDMGTRVLRSVLQGDGRVVPVDAV